MLNLNRESGNISIDNEVFTYFAGEAATSCFGVKGMVACVKEGGPVRKEGGRAAAYGTRHAPF